MPQERISEATVEEQRLLFGPMDRLLRAVRERYGVRIAARRGSLVLEGPDDGAVRDVGRRIRRALRRMREGDAPSQEDVEALLLDGGGEEAGAARRGRGGDRPARQAGTRGAHALRRGRGGAARGGLPAEAQARTPNQEAYVAAIRRDDVVFAVGPAGTGKTFLAVAQAVEALRRDEVRKIILTRPAVEAGEKLGFLPGDFQAKINPYLRPLYDALEEMLPVGEFKRYLDADLIEIVPLAYMRGRTLKNAFIILDEGQNTSPAQMKMFLTRMGFGSKVVVNGDVTQVDLPSDAPSGLVHAVGVLDGVRGVGVIRFTGRDIVRHPLVQRIVDAYERRDEEAVRRVAPLRGGAEGPPTESRGEPAADGDAAPSPPPPGEEPA